MTLKSAHAIDLGADGKAVTLDKQGAQGDVYILRIDEKKYGTKLSRSNRIQTSADGRGVVLAYGELTGHHHSIEGELMERPADMPEPSKEELAAASGLTKMLLEKALLPACELFQDTALTEQLVRDQALLRSDLAIGFLVVNADSVTLRHQEHDPIRITKGLYYIGNQVESQGVEERRVAD